MSFFRIYDKPTASCRDGWRSSSIGKQGACSHHGGVKRSGGVISLLGSIVITFFLWTFLFSDKNTNQYNPPKDFESVNNTYYPPFCKKCGSRMTKRVASKGKYKGKPFFGCLRYPRCKSIEKYYEDEENGLKENV